MPVSQDQLLEFLGVKAAEPETQLLNRTIPLTDQELNQVRHFAVNSGDPGAAFNVDRFEQEQNERLAEEDRTGPRLQEQLIRPQLSEISGLSNLDLIRRPRNLIPRT